MHRDLERIVFGGKKLHYILTKKRISFKIYIGHHVKQISDHENINLLCSGHTPGYTSTKLS